MNEDEAFVRAIQESPLELTCRLAYADWLDERSDPRAAFLRAQCEVVTAWRKLAAIQATTPGVWAHRVDLFASAFAVVTANSLGEGIEDAEVGAWLAQLGEHVTIGQSLVGLETLKASLELVAEVNGIVVAQLFAVGQTVPVGSPIALLLQLDDAAPTTR